MQNKNWYLYLLPLLLAAATPLAARAPEKNKKAQKQNGKRFVAPDAEIKTLEVTPFKDISREYMKGFVEPERDEDEGIQQKKLRTAIPQISEYDLFSHIFSLYQTVKLDDITVFNRNGWKDLEILCGEHAERANLVNFLKHSQTTLGLVYSSYLISHPIGDFATLQNRQNVVKELVTNTSLARTVRKALKDVASAENNFFFFWETESDFNMKAISSYFFTSNLPGLKNLKAFNTNPYFMEALCLKGRALSYSLPAVIPVSAFLATRIGHYWSTCSQPHKKLKRGEKFKELEKKFEKTFAEATPEQKKEFLESLAKASKGKWFVYNIKKMLGGSCYESIKGEDGTYSSYNEAAEKFGHYKAQQMYNDQYRQQTNGWSLSGIGNQGDAEHLPFSLKNQAKRAANAALSLSEKERSIFVDVFKKSFGSLPSEQVELIAEWKPVEQKLMSESRAFAGRTLINNVNPFQKELRNAKTLKDIKSIETFEKNFKEDGWVQAFSGFMDDFGFVDKYTAGDKRKFFSLMNDYLETKPTGIPETMLDYAKSSVGVASKTHLYGSGFFAALEAMTIGYAYSREKSYNALTNYVHDQMMAVATVIRAMETLSAEIKDNVVLREGLEHHRQLTALFNSKSTVVSEKMHQLVQLLLTNTFTGKPSYFSFKGRVLAAYALMKEIKNELAPALLALGEVDAYLSCATLYNEYQGKSNGYCFVDFLNQDTPYINLEGMWNPFVGSEKAVANSIELGGAKPLNVILTGPNAGGKSTFSKGLTISVLLAQTIGMAPASRLALTPFEKINTYMNITDDTAGGNSLFKSEVLRAQELLKTIADLPKNKFTFSIMDEMFSGTSPREGEAAGYAVAKNLGANTNSIAVIATHFPKLKELEKTTGLFKNYQVRVAYRPDGSFSYPFKLEEGAADQNVAIAILQQQGFDSSILSDAQELLKVPTPTAAVSEREQDQASPR